MIDQLPGGFRWHFTDEELGWDAEELFGPDDDESSEEEEGE